MSKVTFPMSIDPALKKKLAFIAQRRATSVAEMLTSLALKYIPQEYPCNHDNPMKHDHECPICWMKIQFRAEMSKRNDA